MAYSQAAPAACGDAAAAAGRRRRCGSGRGPRHRGAAAGPCCARGEWAVWALGGAAPLPSTPCSPLPQPHSPPPCPPAFFSPTHLPVPPGPHLLVLLRGCGYEAPAMAQWWARITRPATPHTTTTPLLRVPAVAQAAADHLAANAASRPASAAANALRRGSHGSGRGRGGAGGCCCGCRGGGAHCACGRAAPGACGRRRRPLRRPRRPLASCRRRRGTTHWPRLQPTWWRRLTRTAWPRSNGRRVTPHLGRSLPLTCARSCSRACRA